MIRIAFLCLLISAASSAEPFRGYVLTDDERVFIAVDDTDDILVHTKQTTQDFESRIAQPGHLFIETSVNEIALTTHGTAYGFDQNNGSLSIPISKSAESHEIDNSHFKQHETATVVITTPTRSILFTYTIFDKRRIVSLVPMSND